MILKNCKARWSLRKRKNCHLTSADVKVYNTFLVGILIQLALVSQSQGQSYPSSPEPWRAEYENISLNDFEFTHPMTVLNRKELDIIKVRIANDVEPQKSAYSSFLSEASVQLNFSPNPPESLDIPGGYDDSEGLSAARDLLWKNCHAAYTCALAYALTDEEQYAQKAIAILMAWAEKNTTFTGADRGLQLGSYFSPMLYAADLLHGYEGWTKTERETFETWWREKCLDSGAVLDVMRNKDNNWKDAGLLGTFAASVVFEDAALLHESIIQLKSYFYTRTDKTVRLPGAGWKIKKDENGVYLPREVVRNDGSSGLTYTAYALTTMVQALEIARYAGFYFWNDTTEEGASLTELINQYYQWDIVGQQFPWGVANKSDKRRNLYELANNYLDIDQELKDFIKEVRPVVAREGDAYSTLNKGDMKGQDTIIISAPKDFKVTPKSSGKIQLQWNSSEVAGYAYIVERKSSGEFEQIARLGTDKVSLLDTGLNAGTNYVYRVGTFNFSTPTRYTPEIVATTQAAPTNSPMAPSGLALEAVSASDLLLTWSDNSDDEEGFIIERLQGDSFEMIGEVTVDISKYRDTGLTPGINYSYRVSAFNSFAASDYSNVASSKTQDVGGLYQEKDGLLAFEAELGNVGGRWMRVNDPDASGGQLIEISPELNIIEDTPECTERPCLARYFFQVQNAGDYRLLYRMLSAGGQTDSFFWRIDGGAWIRENGNSGVFDWYIINNPIIAGLSVGNHLFEISYRENGTQLDKFIFQFGEFETPEDQGPVPSEIISDNPPEAPSNVTVASVTTNSIKLNWVDNSTDEDGFVIETMGDSGFEEIATLSSDVTSFDDTDLSPATSYTYRIASVREGIKSHYTPNTTTSTEAIPNEAPVAQFTTSLTSGNAPLSIDFDASGSSDPDGDELTYSWNFGDGTTAEGIMSNHTFEEEGVFTVTLEVMDDKGAKDEASSNIEVNSPVLSTDVTAFRDLVAYPNPSHGLIHIEMGSYQGQELRIYDVSGSLVYFKEEVYEPLLIELEQGIYLLKSINSMVRIMIF